MHVVLVRFTNACNINYLLGYPEISTLYICVIYRSLCIYNRKFPTTHDTYLILVISNTHKNIHHYWSPYRECVLGVLIKSISVILLLPTGYIVCLFGFYRPTREFFTHMNFDLCSALMVNEQWEYGDTGHPLIMVISKDQMNSHLMSSVWQWNCRSPPIFTT